MRELTYEEICEVSGGAVAPFREVGMGALSGGLSGVLAGARFGLWGAVGFGVFGAASGASMVMVRYALH
jgi:Mg/Co/Ni transporter MgtE